MKFYLKFYSIYYNSIFVTSLNRSRFYNGGMLKVASDIFNSRSRRDCTNITITTFFLLWFFGQTFFQPLVALAAPGAPSSSDWRNDPMVHYQKVQSKNLLLILYIYRPTFYSNVLVSSKLWPCRVFLGRPRQEEIVYNVSTSTLLQFLGHNPKEI